MVTMFSTAKPFRGRAAMQQRNALESWKRLHATAEIILFGDEEGAAEVCAELGLRHEAKVERDERGLKYVDWMFRRAQRIAKHDYVCYANCDMVLLPDFRRGLEIAIGWATRFLLVGRRWDTEVSEAIDFGEERWAERLRRRAVTCGKKQIADYVDYFVFPRGFYGEVPRLVVGRSYWDHWLVWRARAGGLPVVDGSRFIVAVHQNHDYGYHAKGKAGTNEDEMALRNVQRAGGPEHLRSVRDATHAITAGGRILPTPLRGPLARIYELRSKQVWLERTLKVRSRLGLRRRGGEGAAAAAGGAKG